MAKVLVVGGAGYVGSATCALLIDQGHDVWILDDLSTGHSELILTPHFVRGKVGNRDLVRALLSREKFDCVFHFAARNIVSESVLKRDEYFENNVNQTQVLLEEMLHQKWDLSFAPRFVFSSSCAIFGESGGTSRLHENLTPAPLNPYGETKLVVENLLKNQYAQQGIQSVVLRYFNASGAEQRIRAGEWHVPETHLIPKIFQAVVENKPVSVFGDDYPTPDGTAIRDYIHVTDLARAHVAAMNKLLSLPVERGAFFDFNLGSEKGYSVKEVIQETENLMGERVKVEIRPRRPGDAIMLVADSSKAKKELGFEPKIGLSEILKSAWEWEQKRLQIKPKRAVFLDRDETLNPDTGYIHDPDHLELYPWVAPLIKKLKENQFDVFVVSNQSGVGRGLITWQELHTINLKLNSLLFAQSQIKLNDIANCPHHPQDQCDCRKPKPGLFHELAQKFNLDLTQSYMIGDRDSDREAGLNAGVRKSFKIGSGDQAGLNQAIESILKT